MAEAAAVGSHAIEITDAQGSGLRNYTIFYEDASLTVSPLAITVTANALSKTYGENDPALIYTVLPSLVSGDAFTGILERDPGENVGTYLIKQGDLSGGANYDFTFVGVDFVIEKATIMGVTFDDAGFVYDGQVHSLAVRGLPTGATVNYVNNDKIEAGEYTVTATISQVNYNDEVLTAKLTMNQASATIAADAVQRYIYDGVLKNIAASLNHGETTLDYSPQQGYTEAGIYDITISSKETANYLAANQTVQLIIEKGGFGNLVLKSKTVTFNGKTHSLELENLPPSAAVVYDNNGQTDAGIYTITARATHPNFEEQTLTAILTINKADQRISFAEIGTVSRDVGRVALNVIASSGLPVTVVGDDNLVATVDGNDLLVHRLGTVRLTATQEGDKNHEAAVLVSIIVRVANDADKDPIRVHQALSPNGDGINDFLIIEGIKDYPDNKLTVLTRNGRRVFSIDGYDNESRVFKGIGNSGGSGGTLPQGTYFYVLEYKDGGERKVKKGWFVLKF